jgi:hypothetical protein
MKSSRNGNAGVDLISDNHAGCENTVFNIGFSSMASDIDALERSLNYYAEFVELFGPAMLLIVRQPSTAIMP